MTQFPDMEDKTVRHDYLTEKVTLGIGEQIKAMREARGWSYAEMGKKMNRGEFWVARLEKPDYEKYGLPLLLEIAAVFDVWLDLKFVPYREGQAKAGEPYSTALSFERERRAAASAGVEPVVEPVGTAGGPKTEAPAPAAVTPEPKPVTPEPFGNWPDKSATAKTEKAPVSEPWVSRGAQDKAMKKK